MLVNNIIPRKLLFGSPDRLAPQISPDGTKMAFLAPVNNVMNIWVGSIEKDDFKPVTKNYQRGIGNYFWAQDNKQILYLQDVGGDENWHLHSINLETGSSEDLTPFDGVQTKLAEHDMHFPNDVILAMNLDNSQLHDIYHLDLSTRQLTKMAENSGNVVGWEIDTNLEVRGVFTTGTDGGYEFYIRDNNFEWKLLANWNIEDSQNIGVETFSKDNKYVYLRDSRNHNASRLIKIELETGNSEVIFEDPEYDVNHVMTHPESYEPQLISVAKARNETYIIDETIMNDVEKVAQLNPGDYVIYDRDNTDKKWVIGFTEDNAPASFYLYDRVKQKGKLLFYTKPELSNYQLAEMEPFSFTSRDGLTIHGYITFPIGLERKNLPMVLNVHGGPWLRDTWGYNPEAQWIANRGYICLQVNYRGSVGYGKNFLNAGNREWGGKMHNDLVDAVNWAVNQGYADKEKVAIYGISYGGYSALIGATFTPDTFCCAISVVGPSNLITLIKNIPPYWKSHLENLIKRVGDPETEEEFLKSRSPLYKVDQIKIPVLIAQGANDPRVKRSESEQIVQAMEKRGIYYEYLLFPDEGHGFTKPENRIKFYAIAEKFLARFLGGRYEDISDLEILN